MGRSTPRDRSATPRGGNDRVGPSSSRAIGGVCAARWRSAWCLQSVRPISTTRIRRLGDPPRYKRRSSPTAPTDAIIAEASTQYGVDRAGGGGIRVSRVDPMAESGRSEGPQQLLRSYQGWACRIRSTTGRTSSAAEVPEQADGRQTETSRSAGSYNAARARARERGALLQGARGYVRGSAGYGARPRLARTGRPQRRSPSATTPLLVRLSAQQGPRASASGPGSAGSARRLSFPMTAPHLRPAAQIPCRSSTRYVVLEAERSEHHGPAAAGVAVGSARWRAERHRLGASLELHREVVAGFARAARCRREPPPRCRGPRDRGQQYTPPGFGHGAGGMRPGNEPPRSGDRKQVVSARCSAL